MKALVVHPGTQHAFQLAVELNRLHALSGIHTGFVLGDRGLLRRICDSLPTGLQRRIANRRVPELPQELIQCQPMTDGMALASMRVFGGDQRILHWRNARFQKNVPIRALQQADVIIGFDTSSWILARRCRELGKPFVLIQTIGHPDSKQVLYEELQAKYPNWQELDQGRLPGVRRAEQDEHEAATLIVVSSSFTEHTLVENGVDPAKIRIIPHGVDCQRFTVFRGISHRPLRFVFAGSICARKGVPLLLEAWRRLNPREAELWLIGPGAPKAISLLPSLPGLRYLGSVPHGELPALLQQCDVFVFPSLFEGFGLVILQAMACGLPVITTTATAGPDLFRDGNGGWVTRCGDLDSLVSTMRYCLENPEALPAIGACARVIAERFSWRAYGQRWLPVLEEAFVQHQAIARDAQPPVVSAVSVVSAANKVPRDDANQVVQAAKRVLLAHPGTQYSGHLAAQLQRHGLLAEFHTCLAISHGSRIAQLVSRLVPRWEKRLAHRQPANITASQLRTQPYLELKALASLTWGHDEQDVFFRRNASFQNGIPDRSLHGVDTVIGFDTSSWIIGRRARELGLEFILDQSIGHPRSFARVAAQLMAAFPEWAETIPGKSNEELVRESVEHDVASRIVVPSRFVAQTLEDNGVDVDRIRTIPFGVDLDRFRPAVRPPGISPVRFIFVGSLCPRKGVPLLLNAWRALPHGHGAELWIAGGGTMPVSVRRDLPNSIRLLGRRSHAEMLQVLHQCHVFVFPSYFEGLAQVQIEAAACGLPVIGTESSGCAEIVRHGETGIILPTGDLGALRDAMLKFIMDPPLALAMRDRLLVDRQRWSWDAYGDRWMHLLTEVA